MAYSSSHPRPTTAPYQFCIMRASELFSVRASGLAASFGCWLSTLARQPTNVHYRLLAAFLNSAAEEKIGPGAANGRGRQPSQDARGLAVWVPRDGSALRVCSWTEAKAPLLGTPPVRQQQAPGRITSRPTLCPRRPIPSECRDDGYRLALERPERKPGWLFDHLRGQCSPSTSATREIGKTTTTYGVLLHHSALLKHTSYRPSGTQLFNLDEPCSASFDGRSAISQSRSCGLPVGPTARSHPGF